MKTEFWLALAILLISGCIDFGQPPQEPPVFEPPIVPPEPDINAGTDTNADQQPDQNTGIVLPPDEMTKEYCTSLENAAKIDSCLRSLAIEKLDTQLCSLLTVFDKDNCLTDIALQSKNISDCLLITKEAIRNNCLHNVGVQENDNSFCDKIENNVALRDSCYALINPETLAGECVAITDITLRENCYSAKASSQSNYKICSLIAGNIRSGKYYRDTCLDNIYTTFAEPAACFLYFDKDRAQECFFDVGIRNKNLESCKEVENSKKKSDCMKSVAIALEDQSACNDIPDNTVLQACFEHFAQNNPKLETCNEILNDSIKKDCYKDVAVENLDDTICDLIAQLGSEVQVNCYLEIAKKTFEVNTCHKIYPYAFDEKDSCFSLLAKEDLDFELCEYVHFGENYISCFSAIAISVDDFGICDQMNRAFFTGLGYNPKFGCYRDFAVSKSDSGLCELITASLIRESCEGQISP